MRSTSLATPPVCLTGWQPVHPSPPPPGLYAQDLVWWLLYKAEAVLPGSWLRKQALKECMKHVHYEDRNTRYIDIGPVNKVGACVWGGFGPEGVHEARTLRGPK